MPRNIALNAQSVSGALTKTLAECCGIVTYKRLLNIDPTSDDYKTTFCSFYNVVGRSTAWRNAFFEVFADCKSQMENRNTVTLRTILIKMHEKDGIDYFETSFATKMLAMLDPSKPIIDKFVTKHCALNFTNSRNFEERLENAVEQYEILEQSYREFLETEQAAVAIREFDGTFPEHTDISTVKKIDFLIMWKEKFCS